MLLVLLACGLIELTWRRHGPRTRCPSLSRSARPWPESCPPLAWTALKVGGLSFGGGFVTIPLMQRDALANDWLTAAQFANAVAYGQVTPGPVTHTVALIGWGAAGPAGALLASVIAFAPSFLFVLLGGDRFDARCASGPGRAASSTAPGPPRSARSSARRSLLAERDRRGAGSGRCWPRAALGARAPAPADPRAARAALRPA